MSSLNESIARIALETVMETMPSGVYFGTVISSSPLKINVEQKMTLTEAQLVLTRNVTNYQTTMSLDHKTEDKSGGTGEASFASHNHDYKGVKPFIVNNALRVGEKVYLQRIQGGQKFLVIDRVV